MAVPRAQDRAHKTNLMVFIRPTILRNAEDARFQTNAKYRYMQDLQRQMADDRVRLMRRRAAAGVAAAAATTAARRDRARRRTGRTPDGSEPR